MKKVLLAALLVGVGLGAAVLVQASAPYSRSPWGNFIGGLPLSGGTLTGGVTIGGSGSTDCVVYNDDGAQGCTRSVDEAPNPVVVSGQSAFAGAATNTTGGDVSLAPGDGTTKITIDTVGNCATDTVTVTRTIPSGTTYASTATVLTEGTDWNRGASNAAACAALATAIEALSGVSATCSTATVRVTRDTSTRAISLAVSDATCATVANGTDGNVNIHGTLVLVSPGKVRYPSGTIVDLSGTNGYLTVTTSAGAGGALRFASNSIIISPNGGATLDVQAADILMSNSVNFCFTGRGCLASNAAKVMRASGSGSLTGEIAFQLYPQIAAVPAAPATCDATNFGAIQIVDDTNDTAATQICFCGRTNDDATYDWLKVNDPTAACPFY